MNTPYRLNGKLVIGLSKDNPLQQEFVPCKCGCGTLIERFYHSGHVWMVREFVRGHHNRMHPHSKRQIEAVKSLQNNPVWRANYEAGMERRKQNKAWQESVSTDSAKKRWDKRGRTRKQYTCVNCGKLHERQPSKTKPDKFFCSQECKFDFMTGANHPNFTVGTSQYPRGWNKKLKDLILERDGYRCYECGYMGKGLSIHHIDTNKKNLSVTNLVTLCRKCHKLIHWEIIKTGKIREFPKIQSR